MSYRAPFKFKSNIKDFKDFHDFKELIREKIKIEEILNFYTFEIALDHELSTEEKTFKALKELESFTFNFYYWPKYELLGLIQGINLPSIDNLFDGNFYFQNSSDQDYLDEEFEFFPNSLKKEINDFSTKEVFKKFEDDFGYIDEEWEENKEYYCRTYRYDLLVELLNLQNVFWTTETNISKHFKSEIYNFPIVLFFGYEKYKLYQKALKWVKKKQR